MPAYWIALIVLWRINATNIPDFSGLLRNIFLIHPLTSQNVFTGIHQAWTLSIELTFYLCLPWIAKLIGIWTKNKSTNVATRNILVWLLIFYTSAYLYRIVFSQVHYKIFETHAIWFPAHLDSFALGMAISVAVVALNVLPALDGLQHRLTKMWPIFFFFSATAWFWSTQIGWALGLNQSRFRIDLLGHFLYGIASVCFVFPFCLNTGNSRMVKIFGSRLFVWLGTVSYGMYLWHYLFLDGNFANTHMPYDIHDMGIATRMLITIPGTIAIAAVSYYLIERPLLGALSRTMQKRKIQNHLM
jgi:peptidoglycan/LPS O-acetylase OafA/YrhL